MFVISSYSCSVISLFAVVSIIASIAVNIRDLIWGIREKNLVESMAAFSNMVLCSGAMLLVSRLFGCLTLLV